MALVIIGAVVAAVVKINFHKYSIAQDMVFAQVAGNSSASLHTMTSVYARVEGRVRYTEAHQLCAEVPKPCFRNNPDRAQFLATATLSSWTSRELRGAASTARRGQSSTSPIRTPPNERGTNENHNRMLRRFFPKGCDFSKVTDEQVAHAVSWMNNYPRRIHGAPRRDVQKCCGL